MIHSTRLHALLWAATVAALPACTTKTIGPGDYRSHSSQTSFDQGAFMLVMAPSPETLARQNNDAGGDWIPHYTVFIDGRRLIGGRDDGLPPSISVSGFGATWYGFIEAGPHHFALADEGGGPFWFEGDVVVLAGGVTRLYTYGHDGARRGMSVSYPMRQPPDKEHILVANVVLDDSRVEVVSCDDATHCTPVSEPIGPGETFDGNLPLFGGNYGTYPFMSLDSSGAGIGVRSVPTSAVATPPVSSLAYDSGIANPGLAGDAAPLPVSWSVTVMYLVEQGQVWGTN